MNFLRKSVRSYLFARVSLFFLSLAVLALSASQSNRLDASWLIAPQSAAGPAATAQSNPAVGQRCHVEGKTEIAIACDYAEAAVAASDGHAEPRIVLNRAVLWFKAKDDSRMRVDLTFTNAGKDAMKEGRPVYLAIDDDAGQNHLRRPLVHVDLTKIAPGEHLAFSETLRAPAFQPGHYTIQLWIPSADPALKFDSTRNFLIASVGVPDEKSGLNTIATFVVVR
jgi:Domain of unknown function (DUF4832)